MTHRGDIRADIYWPDSNLDSVTYEYDAVRIVVHEDEGATRTVLALGPIGVQHLGLWDEVIIERATLTDDHPFAALCWSEIERRGVGTWDSGSSDRNTRIFKTLEIVLQDGSSVLVAAASFEVEPLVVELD